MTSEEENRHSRRAFFKKVATIGAGTIAAAMTSSVQAFDGKNDSTVPTRPFGKTGANVSILSLGGVLGPADLLVFRQALKLGVTYWDTADSYGWGKNEKAIGKYFSKFPEDRRKVFLVTKSATSNPDKLTQALNRSLERMNTDHVDMYFIHYLSDVQKELTPEVRAWAQKAKAAGKIRLFGFSTHKNMEKCMLAAAGLGWIDGIMASYNYRIMATDPMKRAVEACARAGIGLTAMKTQAAFSANFYATIGSETDDAIKLTDALMKKGYTAEQARLKVVWDNPHIASICSAISNMTILQANVAAALNKTELSLGDKKALDRYARQTSAGYCAGCAAVCESAVDQQVPIADLMRCAMYANSYGDKSKAADIFQALPGDTRADIVKADYTKAEKSCPHNMQIGRILKQLHHDLA
jgi:uncharacterized protein